jgi:hypothetical protein
MNRWLRDEQAVAGCTGYCEMNSLLRDEQVVEERASGVLDQTFIEHRFLNQYKNLTNVVMRIAPRGVSPAAKSLLLAAHFDSTFGSPGLLPEGLGFYPQEGLGFPPWFRLQVPRSTL